MTHSSWLLEQIASGKKLSLEPSLRPGKRQTVLAARECDYILFPDEDAARLYLNRARSVE